MDFSQALQKLTELDLQGQSRGSAFQGDVVFTMTPTAGTEVEVESLVALTPGVAVPDLRGPISEAQRLLVQSGLLGYLKHVQSIPSATTGMGTEVVVDWQSVAPQTVVPRSKRITVSGYRYVPVFTQFPVQPQRNISITLGGFSGQTSGGCGGSASAGSRGGKGCPLPSVCGPAGGRGGMGGGMF
jgi:hypothetical protein